MRKINIKALAASALFLSIGMVLPFLFAQIKEIGDTLLPMHLPIMLCGLLCGPYYGLSVGLLLPFLRSAIFSMPPMYPNAVWMALELATYGFVIGTVYSSTKRHKFGVYIALFSAMLIGRIVWGVSKALLLGIRGSSFTFSAFIAGGFVDSAAGIILQIVLIPLILGIINRIGKKF